ncbi:hypothetical protein ACJX0J_018310, partial [Zea mays]
MQKQYIVSFGEVIMLRLQIHNFVSQNDWAEAFNFHMLHMITIYGMLNVLNSIVIFYFYKKNIVKFTDFLLRMMTLLPLYVGIILTEIQRGTRSFVKKKVGIFTEEKRDGPFSLPASITSLHTQDRTSNLHHGGATAAKLEIQFRSIHQQLDIFRVILMMILAYIVFCCKLAIILSTS